MRTDIQNFCDKKHAPIYHRAWECPWCEMLAEQDAELATLRDENAELRGDDKCPICAENESCRCPETGGYRR